MINEDNFVLMLNALKFSKVGNFYQKTFSDFEYELKVDIQKKQIIYPESSGLIINERQTCNFSASENFVVFECVHRLLEKGYKPINIELEPKWKVGHGASGGRADILVKDNSGKPLILIECKTYGKEFERAWKDTLVDGDQLFSYAQQIPETSYLCMYTAEFNNIGTIDYLSNIISHKDNDKILNENQTVKSFAKAGNVRERYLVWKETYKLEYTTKGVFESNVQAYNIGKDKYTINDLAPVDAKNKEGKYHEFRTILRKHNVSGRENAFDILVNLFLCKIVDETHNAEDLKFYWKGIAYDNYFDMIDRLQELYKVGMDKYFSQEIVYVSNKQIDDAFWAVKQKRNATKQQIKKYFLQLKYFTNNDFAFIDVHNETLFYQNVKILLDIVKMWQDLKIKTSDHNQFLGDLFEYFLDNGIKQSEGQFFTPLPITKFIVMSLPLLELALKRTEFPSVLDYACGAGHFLTEYASQITPIAQTKSGFERTKVYDRIIGIEKEYRLSKVSKLASFMYGYDGIKILHQDALKQNPQVAEGKIDIIISNPPFAVEGFLDTLDENERDNYQLASSISDISSNKNIQCFFIERAKQLLSPGGIAGIIIPSPMLTNPDSTHIKTREIILKFFDIISIVELGGATFSKTGTNTVVLFIKRKEEIPEPSVHYENRVLDWFDNNRKDESEEVYKDNYLISSYCEYLSIDLQQYTSFMSGTINSDLLSSDLFQDYYSVFIDSTDAKQLLKKKAYKLLSEEDQKKEIDNCFYKFVLEREKDRLYYFILAYTGSPKVLAVNAPQSSADQKKYLGYEWSSAKGSEGLRYLNGSSIDDIATPLFDPLNKNNTEKINYSILRAFSGDYVQPKYEQCSFVSTIELLDLANVDFKKAITISNASSAEVEIRLSNLGITKKTLNSISSKSKEELEDEFSKCIEQSTVKYRLSANASFDISIGKRVIAKEIEQSDGIPVYSANVFDPFGKINDYLLEDFSIPSILWGIDGDWMVNYIEKDNAFYPTDHCGVIRVKDKNINPKYFCLALEIAGIHKRFSRSFRASTDRVRLLTIHLPEINIQNEFIKKLEEIEKSIRKTRENI